MMELGFYWSLIFSLFMDVKRKVSFALVRIIATAFYCNTDEK